MSLPAIIRQGSPPPLPPPPPRSPLPLPLLPLLLLLQLMALKGSAAILPLALIKDIKKRMEGCGAPRRMCSFCRTSQNTLTILSSSSLLRWLRPSPSSISSSLCSQLERSHLVHTANSPPFRLHLLSASHFSFLCTQRLQKNKQKKPLISIVGRRGLCFPLISRAAAVIYMEHSRTAPSSTGK